MQERTGPGFERYQFNSLAELAQYLQDTPKRWYGRSSTRPSRDKSWDLGASYDDAWKLARYGWLEGGQAVRKALKALPPATSRPNHVNDFYGHMPHVARFCAGAPDSMVRHARKATNDMGRVLSLVVPVNALAAVQAQYMQNFGVGLAHYIAGLEASGTRVEVIGAIVSRVSGVRCAHTWHIKRAGQPLDLPVLAFAIGHAAMFRRIGFALRERVNTREDASYGKTVPATLDDVINCPKGAFVLNGMASANEVARTPEAASAYIARQLGKVLQNRSAA